MELTSGSKKLGLDRHRVMGIVNVTPDSFSDGGQFSNFNHACQHAEMMIKQGVDIIDIGGESTRPGAQTVELGQELERVIPLIEYIRQRSDVWISIDTSKPQVMEQAVAAGADLINDVRALQAPGAIEIASKLEVPICLMHMQGSPKTMQNAPTYSEIISELLQFFTKRVAVATAAGIQRKQLLIDPGFGFGKTLNHNYEILNRLAELHQLDLPLLIGLSRKSMLGNLLNRKADERLAASLTGAMLAVQRGAHILRVHDTQETLDMLAVVNATNHYTDISV